MGHDMSQWYYLDKDTLELKEGFPPPRYDHFSDGPFIIQDTIEPYRHPMTGQVIESRKQLAETDKATGCITTDKYQAPDPSWARAEAKKRHDSWQRDLKKAVEMIDSGNHGLSEQKRQVCEDQNDRLSKALNFDAYNVAGKKNDKRGKRYGRRK